MYGVKMKYEFKMLGKSKVFYLVLASYLAMFGEYIRRIEYLRREILEYDAPVYLVSPIVEYVIFYFATLMVCAVVYFDIYHKYDMQEVLDAISHKKAERRQIRCLIFVHMCITILIVIGMCGLYISLGEYEPLLMTQIYFNTFFNFGLVGILAILIGKNISNISHSIVKLLVLAGIMLLVSPIKVELLAGNFIDLSFIEIFPENINWAPSGYIGCPIQLQRIMIVLFWICFQFVLLSIYNRKRIICTVFYGGLMTTCFVLALLPRTNLTSELSPNSVTWAKELYYRLQNPQIRKRKVDFKVTSYQMDLEMKNQLYAKVTMKLASEEKQDQYLFTFYHEYQITDIYDDKGNKLKFAHSGDYLAIDSEEMLQSITLEYEGTGAPFYSEYVGTYLSPGFPFFPLAGYHAVVDEEFFWFNDLELEKETDFVVVIHSDKQFYSNLPEVEKNVFQGESKELFLINGMVEEYKVGETRFLFPATYNKPLIKDYIHTFMSDYEQKEQPLRDSLKNKTFVWMPNLNGAEHECVYDDLVMCYLFEPKYLTDFYQTQYVNQLMEEKK